MKKVLSVAVLTVTLLITLLGPASAFVEVNRTCANIFEDVTTGNSLCPYVEYLYIQGVVNGYSDGKFHPNDIVTRGQFAKMIVKAFQLGLGAGDASFPDVPSTSVFYHEINTLKSLGIITGYSDGTFRPDVPVTRGAALKFIENAIATKNPTLFPATQIKVSGIFRDVPDSHAFSSYIARAYAVNDPTLAETIVGGYSDGTFRPDLGMTRAQVAKVLTNSMKYGDVEKLTCVEYFCNDKAPSINGQISGKYFSLKYDTNYWNIKLDNAPSDLGSIGAGQAGTTAGQSLYLESSKYGYSSLTVSVIDMSEPSQPSMNYESIFGILATQEGKSVNQVFGEQFVKQIQDGNLFGSGTVEVLSTSTSPTGLYRAKIKVTNMDHNGQSIDVIGYVESGVKGNLIYSNIGLTDDVMRLQTIEDILGQIKY